MTARSGWERDVLQALTELAVGVVTYRLYSREHPRAAVARQRLCEQLDQLAKKEGVGGGRGELTLVLLDHELFVGDRPFTRTGEQVGGLVRHLRRHDLEHVTFLSGVRPDEIDRFLEYVAGAGDEEPPRSDHVLIGATLFDSGHERHGTGSAGPRPGVAVRDRMRVIGDGFAALREGERLPVASLAEVVAVVDRQLPSIEDPSTLLARLERDEDWPVVHAHNVAVLALTLTVPLGLGEAERRELGLAALLHDVGAADARPEAIARELALEGNEWELDRDHPRRGLELVAPIAELPPLVPIVVFEHHLGLHGDGYPELPERRVPHVAARVVAVAEVFDILHTVRVPRGTCTRKGVGAALRAAAGVELDPFLVQAMEVIRELAEEGPSRGGSADDG